VRLRRPGLLVMGVVCLLTGASLPAALAGVAGEPTPGTIGLTFDDGPHPVWTPVVLDALDALGIEATFFVLGVQVRKFPDLAREIVARGHSIQVHGYSHTDFTRLSDGRVRSEISRTSDLIFETTGVRPTCVRPPYGNTSPRVAAVIAAMGLRQVIWDVNSVDYSAESAEVSYLQVVRLAEAGDDILGHDTLGGTWKRNLPRLFTEFTSRGIGFDTICANHVPAPRRPLRASE
jgi:peptidoglycan-N-acetylglucosamine deacetylase